MDTVSCTSHTYTYGRLGGKDKQSLSIIITHDDRCTALHRYMAQYSIPILETALIQVSTFVTVLLNTGGFNTMLVNN